MSINLKQIWKNVFFLSILLLLSLPTFSQSDPNAVNPDAFDLANLPPAEQEQVAEQAEAKSFNTGLPNGLVLADRMALEYRIAQQRYRFYEVVLLSVVAVVTLMVVLAFMRDNPKCRPRDMVNTTGLILVIFSTIIVILLADVEVQLTAAMGVLGGIAGYLFGTINSPGSDRGSRREAESEPEHQSKNEKDKS